MSGTLRIDNNKDIFLNSLTNSFISSRQGNYHSYPLYSRICLGQDWDHRRSTLAGIRGSKLQDAYDFVMAPSRFVKGNKRCSNKLFETDEGDLCCVHFQATQFPGVESLQQVFNALMFYFNNTEMIISERLGDLAVRDDYDCIGGGMANSRVDVTNNQGTTVEASTLIVSQLFDGDDRFGGDLCGVVAIDSVDADELYPYAPSKRVRLDTSGAIILTATRGGRLSDMEAPELEAEPTIVTMHRAAFSKLYRPDFPTSAASEQTLRDGIAHSGDFMLKAIRRIVYGKQ